MPHRPPIKSPKRRARWPSRRPSRQSVRVEVVRSGNCGRVCSGSTTAATAGRPIASNRCPLTLVMCRQAASGAKSGGRSSGHGRRPEFGPRAPDPRSFHDRPFRCPTVLMDLAAAVPFRIRCLFRMQGALPLDPTKGRGLWKPPSMPPNGDSLAGCRGPRRNPRNRWTRVSQRELQGGRQDRSKVSRPSQ